MTPGPPAHLLDDALAADPTRPFLTWYDDATGERLELSVATFANWVAKTAGLLVDGLGVQPGDTIRLLAPVDHWQAVVWSVATWRTGCVLDTASLRPAGAPAAAVVVSGPDTSAADGVDGVDGTDSADVVALSLRPMGAPFAAGTLPAGALDYAREVPAYADRFTGPLPAASAPAAVDSPGTLLDGTALVERAARLAAAWGAAWGARLLVAPTGEAATDDERLDLVLASTVVPLSLAGSVVLVRAADPGALARRAEQERVTAVSRWGNP